MAQSRIAVGIDVGTYQVRVVIAREKGFDPLAAQAPDARKVRYEGQQIAVDF